MAIESLAGTDSLIIDDQTILDGADNDCVVIEFPTDVAIVNKGKNGNCLFTKNEEGTLCNITLRVCLNGQTDKYLTDKLIQYQNDTPKFPLITANFTKRTGDGKGNITKKIFNLSGGVVVKNAGAVDSTVGNVDSVVSVWQLTFANCDTTFNS